VTASQNSAVSVTRPAPRVLVIYKKSAYQIYVRERRHTHIEQLVAARDVGALRLLRAHKDHLHSLESARDVLARLGADAKFRHRSDDTHAQNVDLVVTLGGDGTLLWASHLVSANTPIIAINTAPKDSVGYFCAGTKHELGDVLADALSGKLSATTLTRMQVELNGSVLSKRVLNDALYCHESPAATSRYAVRLGRAYEEQKSSGLWIGPAAGSSAAQRSAGGKIMPIDARELQYVVREPYEINGTKYATCALAGCIWTARTRCTRWRWQHASSFGRAPSHSSCSASSARRPRERKTRAHR
jgi:NAD+ kinase